MHCDPCLMLLYGSFKGDEKAKKVFFALAREDFPTHDTLIRESGLSLHHVRDALNFLRGTGLVWGNGCHGLSDGGHRLLELLRDADQQPEPSEALCDDCLLEISELLPTDGYTVLAQLSGRRVHSRHDLVMGTGITTAKLREVLLTLEGAQLIQSGRGRAFRLSETGQRLERLLRRQQTLRYASGYSGQGASHPSTELRTGPSTELRTGWDSIGVGQSPAAKGPLSLSVVTGGGSTLRRCPSTGS